MWDRFFKESIDTIPYGYSWEPEKTISQRYFQLEWRKIYELLDFFANILEYDTKKDFIEKCNQVFEEENSAYRFIGEQIVPITDQNEIDVIKKALMSPFEEINIHMEKALKKYSDRESPDYPNSIKESVCAVESMARIKTQSKESLADILRTKKLKIHGALIGLLNKINAYRGDALAVGHSTKLEEIPPTKHEALLFLVICSAFVNYLKH